MSSRRQLTGHTVRPQLLLLATLLMLPPTFLLAQAGPELQGPVRPVAPVQTGPTTQFRATHYDVHASLDTTAQVLNGQAKVNLTANVASRVVEVELNQNLKVSLVTDGAGNTLPFERSDTDPGKVRVTLPDIVPADGTVTLQFTYAGPFSNSGTGSPADVHLASIGKDGAALLLPARWFPLTNFPANRYTAEFQIEVPGNLVVVGTGTTTGVPSNVTLAPSTQNGNSQPVTPISPATPPPPPSSGSQRILYTFRVDTPEAAGTFVAAPLQLSPVRAQGIEFSVFTSPATVSTAQSYADSLARIIEFFSSEFGPLPHPGLTIAQIPDGTLSSYAAPGLLLVSPRLWSEKPNERLLANLAAAQWWGGQVLAATPSDAWITDGLARYCEALYIEQSAGKEALNRALEDFAVGALMFENAAPIGEAGQLAPDSEQYRSVVVNKGAMVFHMLRGQMGDANFFALLKDFYSRYAGKAATIHDFEQMAEQRFAQAAPAAAPVHALGNAPAPASLQTPDLRPFFTQWLRSTGIPQFSMNYIVYRTRKGFLIVGKIKQNLDIFRMPVQIEVKTEGNPVFQTVNVVGTESSFSIATFGRPDPNGVIIDPNDYILKSNPQLKVRAIIARGEDLAQQGRYYDAVKQYQDALQQSPNNALANFRMGEAFFYQRNYAASAQAFRDALDGVTDLNSKWTIVWAHIYLGKIYDLQGDRARAVNEYTKARQTGDNTDGAQAEVDKDLKTPYKETTG